MSIEIHGNNKQFWDALEKMTGQLKDDASNRGIADGMDADSIEALAKVAYHAVAAASAAAHGNWHDAAQHMGDMSHAAFNYSSDGLGVFEKGFDWGAHLVGGPNAPTADKLWHEVPGKVGESLGDYIYFAHNPEARPGAALPG